MPEAIEALAAAVLAPFDFDGATGAQIQGNRVTLHLVDGGRGDADGLANGVIVDPGGPGTYVCQTIVDILFVLDGSNSISAPNFALEKPFVQQFLTQFQVADTAARFGVIQFSLNTRREISLSGSAATITDAVGAMTQMLEGQTEMTRALAATRSELAGHGRLRTPAAVILLTDGISSGFAGIVTRYRPVFLPDPDVTSTLTVPAVELMKVGSESISLDAGGIPYNPADPAFGGTYTLTTLDGIGHTIDARTGQLLALADRNGNTLRIRSDGIFSDSGRAVLFTRDVQGRIASVTDPRGHSVVYTYN